MKRNKIIILLYCIVFFLIVSMSIGYFISFYNNFIKDHSDIIKEKKVEYLINYDKSDIISLSNLAYNYNETFNFSIHNYSVDTIGKYKIILDIITPSSNMIDENFVYTLTSKSSSNDKSNIIINKSETPLPMVSKELGSAVITPNNIHEYSLNIKLNNKMSNYLINKVYVCKIRIENISQ